MCSILFWIHLLIYSIFIIYSILRAETMSILTPPQQDNAITGLTTIATGKSKESKTSKLSDQQLKIAAELKAKAIRGAFT